MRKQPPLTLGALVGGLTSLPVMALLYLGEQFAGLPFVPFDLFDWLARVLPGDIITLGIDSIVRLIRTLNLGPISELAKLIEQLLALGIFIAIGFVFGAVIAWAIRRIDGPPWQAGAWTGLVLLLLVAGIELYLGLGTNIMVAAVWLALVLVGWGALVGRSLGQLTSTPVTPVPGGEQVSRRTVLTQLVGGSAAIALGAWGLGTLLKNQQASSGAGQPLANLSSPPPTPTTLPPTPAASPTIETAPIADVPATSTPPPSPTPVPQVTAIATTRDRLQPAPGTRTELTSNEDFYRIDIDTRPVVIQRNSWVLPAEGLFDHPTQLTLADLMAYPPVTQPITLGCISNPVAGDLISTSSWTGLRVRKLLKDLGLRPEAKELYIEAADGFYESVIMDDLMDPRTLLVYGMNGETLPTEHGFPLRIYIPNRYGMKQPKWISRIEAIDHHGPGYWVERGWSAEARPQIVSVIDTVASVAAVDGQIPIGGIAWAGDRGIQKVELKVDDGEWLETTLRVPPLGPLTWVQWRYDWPSTSGPHTFTVRATDGTGTLQTAKVQPVRPNGATGYHSVTRRI
jgi:DMSO/TMAO reductase YedYZ molybdopterin-dependent catalytic subunit